MRWRAAGEAVPARDLIVSPLDRAAFDAAVAVSAALAVVEPGSSGVGGGGFYLLHFARDGRNVMVDARETAPAAATRDMYLDDKGQPRAAASRDGPLAAGIPAEPAGRVWL
ncbi:MAG: gamma-glutamyltransferase, partial [Sphingopyxis sp.]|nr:gamma-glutamyltransferase [Sphingopyxis sp.]